MAIMVDSRATVRFSSRHARLGHLPRRFVLRLVIFGCLGSLISGCQPQVDPTTSPEGSHASRPPSGEVRPLKVVVIDDPALADAVKNEWAAQNEAGLQTLTYTSEQFLELIRQQQWTERADAILFPSPLMGELIERRLIAKMPKRVIADERLGLNDIFPLLRHQEMRWGRTLYAIPLSNSLFSLAVHSSLPDIDQESGFSTWTAFHDWLASSPVPADPQTYRLVMPLKGEWAAHGLLMRAASYVCQNGQISTYFDFRSLQPMIDQPPFVRALRELAGDARLGPAEQLDWLPADAQAAFDRGQALAILSPLGANRTDAASDEEFVSKIQFLRLPVADQVFQYSDGNWSDRTGDDEGQPVPYVGFASRMGAVFQGSRRQHAAWTLLLHLTSLQSSERVGCAAEYPGPFRGLQRDAQPCWMGSAVPTRAAEQYFSLVAESLRQRNGLVAMRIPHQEEYLKSLSSAVRDVVSEKATAEDALTKVAADWDEMTERIGRPTQRSAFKADLGISAER